MGPIRGVLREDVDLGSGHITVSELEVLSMIVNPVESGWAVVQ